MENVSLSSVVWDDVVTTSSSTDDDYSRYLSYVRNLALKIVYICIGTVGVIDNLFVIVVFALFIKITDKVWPTFLKLQCSRSASVCQSVCL